MKHLFIILCFFTLQIAKGQVAESINVTPKKSHNYYSIKQHQNKQAGKICLLSGVSLIAVGGIVAIAGLANSLAYVIA